MVEKQMTIKNDRFLKALRREPVDCTPIWIMRQAGRYLPEYREVRAKAGKFMNLCKTPELACQVTLQPIDRFPLDAAILFSDILTIPDAMGLGLEFLEGEGPHFSKPVRTEEDIVQLPTLDPEQELGYVMDAVRLIKKELHDRVPLIGFSGSPWTIGSYMVEGSGSKSFSNVKKMAFNTPELMHRLLQHLAHSVSDYLLAQMAAGVDVVMIFDTWGGMLSTPDYHAFSLVYMQQVVRKIRENTAFSHIPMVLFTKNGGMWLESIALTGCDAVGLDWTIDIGSARERIGDKVALQGNLDPAMLYASPQKIEAAVADILNRFGSHYGHVFNLGHGIEPGIDPEHVSVLVDAVHRLSRR